MARKAGNNNDDMIHISIASDKTYRPIFGGYPNTIYLLKRLRVSYLLAILSTIAKYD